MKRVIHIDTKNRKITETEVEGLPGMQKLVGGRIECAGQLPNGDEVFVNEEGLFEDKAPFFDIGLHQPFAGNAFVIGPLDSRGNSTSVQSNVGMISLLVKWLGVP